MTTSMTPAPPVTFSELKTTELCKWCQSDIAVDGRGFIVCPHCDRDCARVKPCELCARVHVRYDWTADEAVAASDRSVPGYVGRTRRFWYALRTWLPPWPMDPPAAADEVEA